VGVLPEELPGEAGAEGDNVWPAAGDALLARRMQDSSRAPLVKAAIVVKIC